MHRSITTIALVGLAVAGLGMVYRRRRIAATGLASEGVWSEGEALAQTHPSDTGGAALTEATQEFGRRSRWPVPALASARQGWVLVAGGLLLLFYITSYLLPRVPSADLNIYVLQPLLWSSLGVLALGLWRREMRGTAFPIDRWLLVTAVLVGLFQIALFVLAGVLAGFGNSPYAHRIHLMALNIWFVGTRLVGLELARWYLVVALGPRSVLLGVAVAWLLLSLVAVPVASFDQLREAETAFRMSGRTLLPTASENLLATYLVLVGGPLASIAYRGSLAAFEWLSPILPNLKWTITAFLGTVAPALGLLIVRDLMEWRTAPQETATKGSSWGMGWVLVAVLAVFLFWFNTGLFGVRPALISGHSMDPTLMVGDIAITREVSASDIEVGDIVRYRLGGTSILHRVLEIRREGGRTVFITKGDNNNVEDRPVDESQLEGKLVVTIPKVGWVPIGLKKLIDRLL